MDGKIKKIFAENGFGFILSPVRGQKDIFFHITDMADRSRFSELREEQPVAYDLGDNTRGPRAVNVRLVPSSHTDVSADAIKQ